MTKSHANEIPSPKYPVLNRVVDSFDVRVWRDVGPSDWLQDHLAEIREAIAVFRPDPLTIELPGLGTFEIRKSPRVYEFKLQNKRLGDIHVWNPDKWRGKQVSQTGSVYVSFRSVFLQAGGYPAVQRFLERLERLLYGRVRLFTPEAPESFTRISRADISVDYADLTIHDLTEKERATHCVIKWADIDQYQARGKRLKREGWFSPFKESFPEVMDGVLRRAGSSYLNLKKRLEPVEAQQKTGANPTSDNRGGHCSIPSHETAVRAKPALGLSDLETLSETMFGPAAFAAERGVMLFAGMLLEANLRDGSAFTTRVIGSRTGPQTIYFGRYGGNLYAREYNKFASLFVQDKLYMLDTWIKAGWDWESPVWRCEYSLAGEFLQQFVDTKTGERIDLREPGAFFDHIPQVWGYLTRTWLRHTKPSQDKTRSRWSPSDRWTTVQNAWTSTDYLIRLERPPTPNEAHLKPGQRGYTVSQVAIVAAKPETVAQAKLDVTAGKPKPTRSIDIDKQNRAITKRALEIAKEKVLESLRAVMFDDAEGVRFDQDALERQVSFGLDEFSDAGFSAMLRADRMREEGGS
jgi:hypothetical protein